MRRLSLVLLVALVAACAGSTAAPKVEPPGIARVVLVSTVGTIFTGQALPGQRLVAQVLDSAGQATTYDSLVLIASPGWTVRGDTLIAPNTPGVGGVRVKAVRIDPSSAVSDQVAIANVTDIRTARKALDSTGVVCHYVAGNPQSYSDVYGPIDSVAFDRQVVDSAGYGADSTHPGVTYLVGTYGLAGGLYLSARVTTYYRDTATTTTATAILPIRREVPDSLYIVGPTARRDTLYAIPAVYMCMVRIVTWIGGPTMGEGSYELATPDTLTLTIAPQGVSATARRL